MLSLLAILSGFTFLSFGVTTDYFEYRTMSVVAIYHYSGNVDAPSTVICFRFDIHQHFELTTNELFTGNFFNDMNDTWKVLEIGARIPTKKIPEYVTKKYIMGNKYCMRIKVLDYFSIDEVNSARYLDLPIFYNFTVSTTPLQSENVWIINKNYSCLPTLAFFQMVLNEAKASDDSTSRFVYKDVCKTGKKKYEISLTYSLSANVKLPYPYDTDCFDYQKQGLFSSHHDCLDKCLKDRTVKWNFIPGMTIIPKDVYNRTDALVAQGHILEDKDKLSALIESNKTLPEKLLQTYRHIQDEWEGIKTSCSQSCPAINCVTRKISPHFEYFNGLDLLSENESSPLVIDLRIRTPYRHTIQATYVPKQKLIDYIVYMSSMFSFWIGFCPLTLVQTLVHKLRQYKKKKTPVALEERIQRLERTKERWERYLCRHIGIRNDRPLFTHWARNY